MRMRKKPNLDARMEKASETLVRDYGELRGRWRTLMPECRELRLELGCGKGRFTVGTASAEPDVLLVAIERVPDAMVVGMERTRDAGLKNIRFVDCDAARLAEIFDEGEADVIYINFCDPWPKSRDAKHRLTAPSFLRRCATVLRTGGCVCFKTDNLPLFDWSEQQFAAEGWELSDITRDLHANGPTGVMTDYEAKFYSQGVKINRLVAYRTAETKTLAAGEPPRLYRAGLRDARGYAESMEAARE